MYVSNFFEFEAWSAPSKPGRVLASTSPALIHDHDEKTSRDHDEKTSRLSSNKLTIVTRDYADCIKGYETKVKTLVKPELSKVTEKLNEISPLPNWEILDDDVCRTHTDRPAVLMQSITHGSCQEGCDSEAKCK